MKGRSNLHNNRPRLRNKRNPSTAFIKINKSKKEKNRSEEWLLKEHEKYSKKKEEKFNLANFFKEAILPELIKNHIKKEEMKNVIGKIISAGYSKEFLEYAKKLKEENPSLYAKFNALAEFEPKKKSKKRQGFSL